MVGFRVNFMGFHIKRWALAPSDNNKAKQLLQMHALVFALNGKT